MVDDLPNLGAIFEGKNTVANRDSIRGNPNVTPGGLNSLKIEQLSTAGKDFQTFLSNRSDGLLVARLDGGVTIRYAIQECPETGHPSRGARFATPFLIMPRLSKIGQISSASASPLVAKPSPPLGTAFCHLWQKTISPINRGRIARLFLNNLDRCNLSQRVAMKSSSAEKDRLLAVFSLFLHQSLGSE